MWRGELELVYGYASGRTSLKRNFCVAPLKVQRPFYPEGDGVCHTVTLHTAGGIVGGDRLQQKISLRPSARALITTASAGKVYRTNGAGAVTRIEIDLEEGAVLEWLPQEAIVFNGADYRQNLRVNLGVNSHWLGWDITRFGRTAGGERFLEGSWYSATEIYRDGHPLWIDRSFCPGGEEAIDGPGGLHGRAIVANLVYVGHPLDRGAIDTIRDLGRESIAAGEWGVSQTLGDGLICRYRGDSTAEVRGYFVRVWHFLRDRVFGLPPVYPRVWPEVQSPR